MFEGVGVCLCVCIRVREPHALSAEVDVRGLGGPQVILPYSGHALQKEPKGGRGSFLFFSEEEGLARGRRGQRSKDAEKWNNGEGGQIEKGQKRGRAQDFSTDCPLSRLALCIRVQCTF